MTQQRRRRPPAGDALPAAGKDAPPDVSREWLLAGSLFLLGLPWT
jgi:hypothetical protein